MTGTLPKKTYVDRDYIGHGVDSTAVWIAAAKHGRTTGITKKLKHRNAVKLVIVLMKNDGSLRRNFHNGQMSNALNALLCDSGHNLRTILRQLALLCPIFGNSFYTLFCKILYMPINIK